MFWTESTFHSVGSQMLPWTPPICPKIQTGRVLELSLLWLMVNGHYCTKMPTMFGYLFHHAPMIKNPSLWMYLSLTMAIKPFLILIEVYVLYLWICYLVVLTINWIMLYSCYSSMSVCAAPCANYCMLENVSHVFISWWKWGWSNDLQ